jgi:hypothetical protein
MTGEPNFGGISSADAGAQSATASKLRRLLPVCPRCHQTIAGHQFARISSAVASPDREGDLERFFAAFQAQEWRTLVQFQEWQADGDAMIVYAIRGQHDVVVLVMLREFFELFEADELFLWTIVEDRSIDQTLRLLAPKWSSL